MNAIWVSTKTRPCAEVRDVTALEVWPRDLVRQLGVQLLDGRPCADYRPWTVVLWPDRAALLSGPQEPMFREEPFDGRVRVQGLVAIIEAVSPFANGHEPVRGTHSLQLFM